MYNKSIILYNLILSKFNILIFEMGFKMIQIILVMKRINLLLYLHVTVKVGIPVKPRTYWEILDFTDCFW